MRRVLLHVSSSHACSVLIEPLPAVSGFHAQYTTDKCPRACTGNGHCGAEGCECLPGFSGSDCSRKVCTGTTVLTEGSATFGDNSEDFACVWAWAREGNDVMAYSPVAVAGPSQ